MIEVHDFARLSPHDFELLVRDIARDRFGVPFESFGPGSDRGIDLRSNGDGPTIIIQCKRYSESAHRTLLAAVQAEASKVAALAPAVYVLASSRRATPSNKAEIEQTIADWALRTEVWTGNNLVDHLNDHPDTVLRHPKLWMPANQVLRRLLNRAQHSRTTEFLQRAREELDVFVTSELRDEAAKKLRTHRIVVLTGDPGAGKTSLAQNLALEHAAEGHEVHLLVNGIEEGHDLLESNTDQLFVFDDFLGRSKLDDILARNEGSDLSLFCSALRRTASSKLILTSRSYVLNAATAQDETLNDLAGSLENVVVSASAYSEIDRARILYNHLHFSKLPRESLQELVKTRIYRQIISHRHYSPRLVSAIIQRSLHEDVQPSGFPDFFREAIADPSRFWTDTFKHLRRREMLLLAVLRVSEGERLSAVRESWRTAMTEAGIGDQTSSLAFEDCIRVLEPTFVRVSTMGERQTMGFANPGVADVASSLLADDAGLVRTSLGSVTMPSQLRQIDEWSSPQGRPGEALDLTEYRDDVAAASQRLLQTRQGHSEASLVALARVVSRAGLRWEEVDGLQEALATVAEQLDASEIVPFWNSLPTDEDDPIVRETLLALASAHLREDGIYSQHSVVAAAELLNEFGTDLDVDRSELADQVATVVTEALEQAAEGTLPEVDVDELLWAASEFNFDADEELVDRARRVTSYEPDLDELRRPLARAGADDIDRLFESL